MTEFYSCRQLDRNNFRLTKFDRDFNVLSTYETSVHGCECPAGHKPNCRHREMLLIFRSSGHVGDGWMIDWHTRLWWQPQNGDVAAAVEELTLAGIAEKKGELMPGVTVYEFASTLPASDSSPPPRTQEVQEGATLPARSGPEVEHGSQRAPSGSTYQRRRFV